MKKLYVLLVIAFPLLTTALNGKARTQTAPDKSLIAQGKTRYADYKCGDCHGPNGEGTPDGPDLVGTRLTATEISKFLEKPSPDASMKGMPNIPVDSPDHQPLVAYVLSLKPPPNPPQGSSLAVHKLSATEKSHILDGDFTIEKDVTRLPDSLKSAFASMAKESDFKMANPGEKFQVGDVVGAGLPERRLIFAGISKDRYFIYYERGGRAHTFLMAVFDVNPEGIVSFLCGGFLSQSAKDLAQLRTLVSSKAFADNETHYW